MFAEFIRRWRSFWFKPQPTEPISLFRIFFGLITIQNALIHTWPGFLSWYGSKGLVCLDTIIKYNWQGVPRFDFLLMLPQGDQWIVATFWAYVVAALFLTVGLFTRYAAIFVALSLISFHHHDVYNLHGGDTFQRLAAIFLCFSHAGATYSIDSLLRKRRGLATTPELYSPWAQRMLQVQVVIIYGHSFFCKMIGPEWLDGTAVYYATRMDDLIRLPMSFLFDKLWVCKLLTWYALFVEFSMCTFVWIRKVRYIVLASSALLHVAIDAALNIPVFEWLMVASLINFVEPEDLMRLTNATKS